MGARWLKLLQIPWMENLRAEIVEEVVLYFVSMSSSFLLFVRNNSFWSLDIIFILLSWKACDLKVMSFSMDL